LGLLSARPEFSDLDGIPLMALRAPRFTHSEEVFKRVVDLLLGGCVTVLSLPLLACIALAIRLESPGSVLYVQKRVGKGGKYFNFYKFRSMFQDADSRKAALIAENEAGGHLFKIRRDPRLTRVGTAIRRLSLDELPQLFNVLKGDMSLVGPRPLPRDDLPKELSETPYSLWLERRRSVIPGITGLWQVNGRSDLPFEEMVRFDLFYVENWSLFLDIRILWQTIPVIIKGKGAY
jgi:exopolysaccharide biosynthesis polyprenyl glycosylphosphotransferase